MSSVFDALWPHADALFSLDVVDLADLPRSPSLVREHLPSLFRRYIKSDPDWELVKDSMITNSSSWGYINNTFDALEPEFLNFSRKKMDITVFLRLVRLVCWAARILQVGEVPVVHQFLTTLLGLGLMGVLMVLFCMCVSEVKYYSNQPN